MKIIKAEYITSALVPSKYPKSNLPEIAFVGRSNVGKSSLINKILNRKKLVKTSSTPGKTQMINFFNINDELIFVDLPGYGYANVPKRVKASWQEMIETYLEKRDVLKGVIHIVDSRHTPSKDDRSMTDWLNYCNIEKMTVASKVDKIPKSKRNRNKKDIFNTLTLDDTKKPFCFFSAKTGEGKDTIFEVIKKWTII